MSIVPKRELGTWGDILLLNHHFGVTVALGWVTLALGWGSYNLPSPSNEGPFPQWSFKVQPATLEQKHPNGPETGVAFSRFFKIHTCSPNMKPV